MQRTLFDISVKTIADISNPKTYKGIYSFHKYWGKKPIESILYFIQNYTKEADIVLDPFLGSGLISKECLLRNRRFIGIDLNPFSIEHTKFLLDLPKPQEYLKAIKEIEKNIKDKINTSYKLQNNMTASHFLWNENKIIKIWVKSEAKKTEYEATLFDYNKIKEYSEYNVKNIRNLVFFNNSRINTKSEMSLFDLFTKRAVYNMDMIIDEINKYSSSLQRALFLTLTSASGQMSSMVFAVTGRGKTQNKISTKTEVGSWVIGFWRPELHFEINVWNCFENRAKKLYKALLETDIQTYNIFNSIEPLLKTDKGAAIINDNSLFTLKSIEDKSIKLICTDPPHSDRIPYLELSEIWNSILNKQVNFEEEIIVSNAKERNKKKTNYIEDMKILIKESARILTDDGLFLLYYNAKDKQSWKFMEIVETIGDFEFIGAFPLEYSANSVIQDNRKGGMKTDYVLIMKHKNIDISQNNEFNKIQGWIETLPKFETII